MPKWLNDAVFYEIYPQSFYDTNGDGIGDINGVTEPLDYIKSLGCNAIWLNPCFDSPFKDAGYDVRDYKKVAPRYGTNEDLVRCFEEAHKRGMYILLDLVPCHTSEEHPWFVESCKDERNPYSDRYIWTSHCFERADGLPCVGGEAERSGTYVLSFFKCQPSLNYGFYEVKQPWQLPMDHPACLATREAMKDVMRFWLDKGCDGFRVDMAGCLVKNDDEQLGTSAVWRDVRAMLDAEYPEAALLSEWGNPRRALKAGFHMDFCLHNEVAAYHTLLRAYDGAIYGEVRGEDKSYFRRDSGASIVPFVKQYQEDLAATKNDGLFCFITCNHDTMRPRANLTPDELKLAYAFLFTLPGAPFLYYGDEIGMRYIKLPTKEGGYFRTGSRTPMQWNGGANLGFSAGDTDSLYLPVDPAPDAPTVAGQEADPDSLLHTVRAILALRHAEPELWANAPFSVHFAEEGSRLFVFRRGSLYVAVNPGAVECAFDAPGARAILFSIGSCTVAEGSGRVTLGAQSFAVLRSTP